MFSLRQLQKRVNVIAYNFRERSRYKSVDDASATVIIDVQGRSLQFPAVWLRDNCQCRQCFHPTAKSRVLDWNKFDIDVAARDVQNSEKSVTVLWDDGHVSEYEKEWLKFRSFCEEDQQNYTETLYRPAKVHWTGENFKKIFTKHDFQEVVKSDESTVKLLNNLAVYGVALVQNAPNSNKATDELVSKIAFPKQTHYGVKFTVHSVPNTSNVAYQSSDLPVHVDLPYYEYCPGVNILHCVSQTTSSGGENVLSDGNYVAEYMKREYPDEYRILSEIDTEWSDVGIEDGHEFFKLFRSPVINLDKQGQVSRINFSIPQRGSHFPGPMESVKSWYSAYTTFYKLNLKFSAKFKTKSGDILMFDNNRLLHGRTAYEDSSNNVRKLIGVYVDWDEIYSRLRCLKLKINRIKGI